MHTISVAPHKTFSFITRWPALATIIVTHLIDTLIKFCIVGAHRVVWSRPDTWRLDIYVSLSIPLIAYRLGLKFDFLWTEQTPGKRTMNIQSGENGWHPAFYVVPLHCSGGCCTRIGSTSVWRDSCTVLLISGRGSTLERCCSRNSRGEVIHKAYTSQGKFCIDGSIPAHI